MSFSPQVTASPIYECPSCNALTMMRSCPICKVSTHPATTASTGSVMQRVGESIPRARLAGIVNSASPANTSRSHSKNMPSPRAHNHSKVLFTQSASPNPRREADHSSGSSPRAADTYLYNPSSSIGVGSDPVYRPHTGAAHPPKNSTPSRPGFGGGIGAAGGIGLVPRYDGPFERLAIEEDDGELEVGQTDADEFHPPAALRGEVARLQSKMQANASDLQIIQREASASALSSGSAVSAATLLEMQELWRTIHYQQDDMSRATTELKHEYDRLKAEYALAVGDRDRLQQEQAHARGQQEALASEHERQLQAMRDELRLMSVRLVQQGDVVVDSKVLLEEAEAKGVTMAAELASSKEEVRQLHDTLRELTLSIDGLQRQRSGDSIAVEAKIAALRLENDSLKAELLPMAAERDELRQHYASAAREAEELEAIVDGMRDELQANHRANEDRAAASMLASELGALSGQLEAERRKVAAMKQTIAAHEANHALLAASLVQKEQQTSPSERVAATPVRSRQGSPQDTSGSPPASAIPEVELLTNQLESEQRKSAALQQTISAHEANHRLLNEEIARLKAAVVSSQDTSSQEAVKSISRLEAELKRHNELHANEKQRLERSKADAQTASDRQLHALSEALSSTKATIDSKDARIDEMSTQLLSLQSDYDDLKVSSQTNTGASAQLVMATEEANKALKLALKEVEGKFLQAQSNFAIAQQQAEALQRKLTAAEGDKKTSANETDLRDAALRARVAELEGVLVALELKVGQARPDRSAMSISAQTSPKLAYGRSAFTSTADLKASAIAAATSPMLLQSLASNISEGSSPKAPSATGGRSAFTSTTDLRGAPAVMKQAAATSPLTRPARDAAISTDRPPQLYSEAVGSDTDEAILASSGASVPTGLFLPIAVDELVAELHQLRETTKNDAELRCLLEEQSEALKETVAEWELEASRLEKALAAAKDELASTEANRQQLSSMLAQANSTAEAQSEDNNTVQTLLAEERHRAESLSSERNALAAKCQSLQSELDHIINEETMRVARQTTRSCSPFIRANPTTERGISPYRIDQRDKGVSPKQGPMAESRGVSPYRIDHRERGVSPLRVANSERGVSPMLGPQSQARGVSPMRAPEAASSVRSERGVSPFRSTSTSIGVGPSSVPHSSRAIGTSPFRSNSPLKATSQVSGGAFQSTLEENEALTAEVEDLQAELAEMRSVAQQRIADLHDLLAAEKASREELERQLDMLQQAYNGELAAHSELKAAVAKMGAKAHHTSSVVEVAEAQEAERRAWAIEREQLKGSTSSFPAASPHEQGIRNSTPTRPRPSPSGSYSETSPKLTSADLYSQQQQPTRQPHPIGIGRLEYRMSTPSTPHRPVASPMEASTSSTLQQPGRPVGPRDASQGQRLHSSTSSQSSATQGGGGAKNRHRTWF